MSKVHSLAKSSSILMLSTILIQGVGLIKEMLVAWRFGTTRSMDSFLVALVVPTFVVGVIGGAIESRVIPVFIQHKNTNLNEADRVFSAYFFFAAIVLLFLSLSLMIFTPLIIALTAPGFSKEEIALTAQFARPLYTYVFFAGISGLLSSFLYAHKAFFAASISGIFIPILTMIAVFFGYNYFSTGVLVIGLLSGSIVQCIILLRAAKKYNLTIFFKRKLLNHPGIRQINKLMPSIIFGFILTNFTRIIDRSMASNLPEGSIAALGYAEKLLNLLSSFFIVTLATAILPYFSEQFSAKKIDEFKTTIRKGIKYNAIVMFPVLFFSTIFAKEIVQILFQRGSFNAISTNSTSAVLTWYNIGLFSFGVSFLLTKAFSAMQNTRVYIIAPIINLGSKIFFNYILIKSMGVSGVALSTSISYTLVGIYLLIELKREVGSINLRSIRVDLVKILITSVFATFIGLSLYHFVKSWGGSIFVNFIIAAIVTFCLYTLILNRIKMPEVEALKGSILKKFNIIKEVTKID